MLAAKEKHASLGATLPQAKTRVWGLPPGNGNGIGGCSTVTSTHVWGCSHVYGGTASGELVNRYYSNAYGRFMTPDPSTASQDPNTPQSWNRYPYVLGDPVNTNDPTGLDGCDPEDPTCGCDPTDPSCGGGFPPPPPTPGVPTTITVPCAVPPVLQQLGNDLGAQSDICETQYNTTNGSGVTVYDLIVPLSDWNQFASGTFGFVPQLSAAGAGAGDIILGGTEIGIGELITGAVLVTATSILAVAALTQIYRGSEGNVADSGVEQQMYALMSKLGCDPCTALSILLNQAKAAGNSQEVQKIIKTQKAYGCRNVQKRGGR